MKLFPGSVVFGGGAAFLSLLAAVPLQASIFPVLTTADSGPGSLRQALLDANANPGLDTIEFEIIGTAPFTITPLSALPTVNDPVVIDGTSQLGYAGKPLIEINGSSLPSQTDGLLILAGGSTVKGLAINRCPRDAIRLQSLGSNVIQGNFLGTDPTGTVARANGEGGLMVMGSAGNLIGGSTPAARNVISGGNQNGVYLYTAGTAGNVISGNFIGTDATGTVALSNVYNGFEVATASSNLIGPGNVISGNGQSGVYFLSGPTLSNAVAGNYIGVSSNGGAALANGADGITLNGAAYTTITSNVLSGNGDSGVYIWTALSTNNVISGNYIGADATGKIALPNQTNGVTFNAASSNVLGGGNVISGNKQFGVLVYSASIGNSIEGNDIGASAAGANPLPNTLGGVEIVGGISNVVGPGNLISGNTGNGLVLASSATGNVIEGNSIGVNATGEKAMPNSAAGIYLAASGNTVGGVIPGLGNLISGNGANGIFVIGVSGNVIEGNLIGTDAAGKTAVSNAYSGIALTNAPGNVIGGSNDLARNIISGNGVSGISLNGAATAGTVIQGNYVGTDLTGTHAVGNLQGGIYSYSSGGNLIGGSAPGQGNVVSGNSEEGISIGDPGANNNTIQGNYIGLQADGVSPLGNQWHNIDLLDTASNNLVGGTNYFAANHIGYALTAQYDGVRVRAGCVGNFIQGNSIFSNAGWGIVINLAGETITNLVTITSVASTSSNTAWNGQSNNPAPGSGLPTLGAPFVPVPTNSTTIQAGMSTYVNGHFYVQFYLNRAADPTGYGEGITYLGATNIATGATGQVSFTVTLPVAVPTGSYLSATATDSAGTTWEFGPDYNVLNGTTAHVAGGGQTMAPNGPAISLTAPAAGSSAGTLSLSWPANLILEETSNLSDRASWTVVSNGITTAGGSNLLTGQPTTPMMFYRLVSTNAAGRTVE